MPESYRCKCGNDSWIILFSDLSGIIKCAKCGKEYEFDYVGGSISYNLPTSKSFNLKNEVYV